MIQTPDQEAPGVRMIMLCWASILTVLLGAAFLAHVTYAKGRGIAEIFLLDQDFPALWLSLLALGLLAPWASRGRAFTSPALNPRLIAAAILALLLVTWAGRYWIFQDYSLSRDEEMAEFAAAYLREGLLARPIPPEWIDYRRALVPEFFSPFGATHYWASSYLPVNSAIRAAFAWLGDANLAAPALLATGLAALWHNARKLFPDRPDAVWITMLMGLTSAQLTLTAMTAYAMTGHFALNMLWIACMIRGDARGHVGAALIALLAAGLHQWHFVLIFLTGFLCWFALQRRWGALAFHSLVCVGIVIVWAKLWPGFLIDQFGPPADIRPSAGVADKLSSLVNRVLRNWYPLAYSVRFIVWNNLALIPLAIAAVVGCGWAGLLRGKSLILPLALGCAAGSVLMTGQVYGWGFRYMHGYIGSFCLLAGYGWIARSPVIPLSGRPLPFRPILLTSALALVSTGFMAWRAHDYVAPYAATDRLIRASKADVVLIDPRGGVYATDLVRGQHGTFTPPLVMSLGHLDIPRLSHLCATHSIAVIDRTDFLPLGIPLARGHNSHIEMLRAFLDTTGCGTPIRPTVAN